MGNAMKEYWEKEKKERWEEYEENKEAYAEWMSMSKSFDIAELRPKVFKTISAYRNMNLDNDKMIEHLTNDILEIFLGNIENH